MLKVFVAGITLVGLIALTAALTTTSGRADPALTHSTSVLPPPLNTCST